MEVQNRKNERIDIRVSLEEKMMFQRAYKISGERTFSGFITRTIRKKSAEIIQESERILASEKDKKIFFDALFSTQEPNRTLKDAAKKFKSTQK